MKWLKTIKRKYNKSYQRKRALNMILDGLWPIEMPETEKEACEAGRDTDSDEEITIRQPQAASSSTLDTIAAILKHMTALTALVQN